MRKILYPFIFLFHMIRVWKNATPEERVALKSRTVSREEKNAIVRQILARLYPEIV